MLKKSVIEQLQEGAMISLDLYALYKLRAYQKFCDCEECAHTVVYLRADGVETGGITFLHDNHPDAVQNAEIAIGLLSPELFYYLDMKQFLNDGVWANVQLAERDKSYVLVIERADWPDSPFIWDPVSKAFLV